MMTSSVTTSKLSADQEVKMTMKAMFSRPLIIAILAALLTGCAGMPVTLSPSSSPLAPGVRGTVPAYGSNCQFFLLGIIPVTQSIDTQAALTEAKRSANADVLTDITVDFSGGYFILFSNNCVRLRGLGVPRGG